MTFVVRMRVTAESASNAQLGIDHLGYGPADVDAVLAVLPVHAHMQHAPSSHPDAPDTGGVLSHNIDRSVRPSAIGIAPTFSSTENRSVPARTYPS